MQKRAFVFVAVSAALLLAGCGGGGTSAPISGGGSSGGGPTTQSLQAEDLFSLDGSDLLNTLEIDAGFTATSSRVAQAVSTGRTPQVSSGPFVFQATGGTATVARPGTATSPAVGFLMTFRDASGLCECSNDVSTLPKPYLTALTNPSWLGGQPFGTRASTTTLGIAYKSGVDSSNHGGTYTATVANPPGGTATFTIANPAVSLPRQSSPTVSFAGNATPNCPVGAAYVTWTPAAGTDEYFVAFLTHLNNDPVKNPGYTVVGFVVTNGTSTCVTPGNFYSKASYQALVIASDVPYIGIYDSQGKSQSPKLPSQIDFSVSQITAFTTP